ncbi:asparagine synthase-related protein [Spirillospora sp. CA-253888]
MDFLILPDSPAGDAILDRLPDRAGTRLVPHASGRPWLVGDWADEHFALVTAGTRRLAVLGRTRLDPTAAERALDRARSPHALDEVARTLPGAFHLLASFDGRTRSQGTISTARQIWYATVDGVTVAAGDPGRLLALTGPRLDPEALALRLMTPVAPWPLSQRSVWAGVSQLPSGHWLHVSPDGTGSPVHWWRPPPAALTLPEAAASLRTALVEAVAVRAAGARTMSADLSGGLDSTSLCFLAAAEGADLLTYHWQPLDRANDDSVWAGRAAGLMPGVRHTVITPDDAPSWFASRPGDGRTRDDVEGPPSWSRNRAHMEHLSQVAAAEGSSTHLIGLGGDELFGAVPGYLWSLVRRHPLRGLRAARRHRTMGRWRLGSTVRGLADRTGFAESLAASADGLTGGPVGAFEAPRGWRGDLRMPPWATGQAVDTARRLLRATAADGARPLDPERYRHQILESVLMSGSAVRQLGLALAPSGVDWEAPYLDDRVIEAALSVRIGERTVWGQYKPVLTTALRGVVPDQILGRRSKGEFSAEVYAGLETNRHTLLELCDDLRLGGLGLVDPGTLRAGLITPGPETRHLTPFENTLACENWLRSPRAHAARATIPAGEPR